MIATSLTWRGRAPPLSCSGETHPLLSARGSWRCVRLCSSVRRQVCPLQSRAPQEWAVSCTGIRAPQMPDLFFLFFSSLLAERRGLGNKAGILSLPSALRQQAWKLAQLIPDLCQAPLIENSSSWIEGSSCHINSGEGGEANVFAGGERRTGSRLILKLLLVLTLCFFMGESQRWESFIFCLDFRVWMLLLLGPRSAAAISLCVNAARQWSHFGFVSGSVSSGSTC